MKKGASATILNFLANSLLFPKANCCKSLYYYLGSRFYLQKKRFSCIFSGRKKKDREDEMLRQQIAYLLGLTCPIRKEQRLHELKLRKELSGEERIEYDLLQEQIAA